MHETTLSASTAILTFIKYGLAFIIPFVEPQLAGMLGSLAYLIVRHELKLATLKLSSICIVMFFGWLGAWATVNILAEYETLADVYVQIISATVGFLSYDALLIFGGNTKSVIGFIAIIGKTIVEKGVSRLWK